MAENSDDAVMDWPHRFDQAMTELALAHRENARLRKALRDLAEAAEVASQGGIYGRNAGCQEGS